MANKIFEPIKIGTLEIPNRIVMPAMASNYADRAGNVTQRLINHYVERAKNRVGLIIIEVTCVAPGGKTIINQIGIYDDAFIPGLRSLAEAVKQAGARCFVQLHHAGRRAVPAQNDSRQPVAPSAIPMRNGAMPRELSIEEIEGIIEAFAQGARRAKEAGFDGVELHFTHGYLIAQFLSPLTNKRTDKYGGDLVSRARLAVEIVRRVRQRVGENYPVTARISGDEYIKGGLTLREAKRVAVMLEEAGVNAIHVSAGYTHSHEEGYLNTPLPVSVASMLMPYGCFLHLAEAIKKVVRVPIITVGRLHDPNMLEDIIAQGKADLIAVGRALFADPAFASKIYNRQFEDIRRCISCCDCLVTSVYQGELKCSVNGELGKEEEYRIKPAPRAKRVLVIGGGPGGMEAARVAALRGHKVMLVEKKPYLGGNMVAASAASCKQEVKHFINYLSRQISKVGVEVSLNTEISREGVLAQKPDVVVLATGASPQMPAIAGAEGVIVTDAVKVLEGKVEAGSKVVIVGAGAVGCETAVFLAERGKEVTVVEMRDTDYSDTGGLAPDMNAVLRRAFLFELWVNLPIDVIGKSTFREIKDGGLVIEDREGNRSFIAADTIVFAIGMKPNNSLKDALKDRVSELYEVGDCVKPGHIIDAVEAAARVARLI